MPPTRERAWLTSVVTMSARTISGLTIQNECCQLIGGDLSISGFNSIVPEGLGK